MTAELSRLRNDAYAHALIAELQKAGVRRFVVCPGSRSTPLVAAVFHRAPEKVDVVLDERGAAYFALGQIRASGCPSVVITTSGTAVANLGPALTEAHQEGLPLLALTANRPAEALGTDENQAVPQRGLFVPLLSFSANIDCVCDEEQTPKSLLQNAKEMVSAWRDATLNCLGPAQLDIAFDKPLEPVSDAPWHSLDLVLSNTSDFTSITSPISKTDSSALRTSMLSAKRGVLLLGRVKSHEQAKEILEWANAIGWLVVSDVLFGKALGPGILQCPIATLATGALDNADVVVQLGGSFVSKDVQLWKSRASASSWWRIDDQHRVGSTAREERVIRAAPNAFCEIQLPSGGGQHWRESILLLDKTHLRNLVSPEESSANVNIEPFWIRHLVDFLPKDKPLFIGNSSPVRDLDEALPRGQLPERIYANRGGSGIDGLMATAGGVAAELGPTIAILGDLTTLHDAASFHLLHELELPLLVIVINNGGGGIFYRLPICNQPKLFEKFFATPHRTSLANVARGFGLSTKQVSSIFELQQEVTRWIADPCPMVLEILTNAEQSHLYREDVNEVSDRKHHD
ncbi:MAG: 2-succinyl-5-enolpyruvyl-6-hydroxy-3-cyclohexene-1-carboxylic-acid synthase [Deltaproteobacteria bacterium]|nr:2-succinyl-5-enolpyruvyl-6-hydroxy-3-cyclohexene-1-carboxylic-acid synthase [Deltaproteobacteria bacterium]